MADNLSDTLIPMLQYHRGGTAFSTTTDPTLAQATDWLNEGVKAVHSALAPKRIAPNVVTPGRLDKLTKVTELDSNGITSSIYALLPDVNTPISYYYGVMGVMAAAPYYRRSREVLINEYYQRKTGDYASDTAENIIYAFQAKEATGAPSVVVSAGLSSVIFFYTTLAADMSTGASTGEFPLDDDLWPLVIHYALWKLYSQKNRNPRKAQKHLKIFEMQLKHLVGDSNSIIEGWGE